MSKEIETATATTSRNTTAEEIQNLLHKGVVTFTFEKKDHSIRTAKGTLVSETLTANGVNSSSRPSSPLVQVFFDLEKGAFRSFTKGTERELISFEETATATK